MEKKKITQTLIQSVPPGTITKFQDTEVPGFQVWFQKTTITYMLYKRISYKLCAYKIGTYPHMSPAQARQEILNRLTEIANRGVTFTTHNDATLQDAVDSYLERFATNRKQFVDNKTCLEKFSSLFSRRIIDITQEEIIRIHTELKDTPVTANHAVKRLSTAIKQYAERMNIPIVNPCKGVKLYPEKPRRRFLDNIEAPKLIEELERLRHIYRYRHQAEALLLMLYTGQRKSTVLAMRTDEIRDGIWVIPGNKAKAAKRDIVHKFNPSALKIIQARKNDIIDGWIFPSHSRDGKIQRLKSCRHTFYLACKNSGIEDCRIHDLRRTLGSWMLISGAPIAEISRTLGHSSIKVTEQVYAHLLPGTIASATQKAIDSMMNKTE